MRSPNPTSKICQPKYKMPSPDDRRPILVPFDIKQFINTVGGGPSNLVVILCIIASMCFSGLVVDEIEVPPFCSNSSSPQDRKCVKCPDFATCNSEKMVCSEPFINKYNFCVIPNSEEDRALKYLPEVRGLTEPKLQKLASKIGVSISLLKLAQLYSNKEVLGGFKTADSFLYLAVAIAAWIGTFYVIYIQLKYKKAHDFAVKALLFMESNPVATHSIGGLCKNIQIMADKNTQERMLKELARVPQLAVDLAGKTVSRKITFVQIIKYK